MALIPPGYMKTVVSLGVDGHPFHHVGTGFLYYHAVSREDDVTHYRPFLITNKHVVDAGVTHVRFNQPTRGSLEVHPISSVKDGEWVTHPNGADVAVMPVVSPGPLMLGRNVHGAEIFIGDVCTPSDEELPLITEGIGVFLVGFPLGLIGDVHNYAIVRSGVIARIQDWLAGEDDTFLIDAPAFPGNSGGPVVVRPDTTAIRHTAAVTQAFLIGMVSHSIMSREVAVNPATGEPRVVFVENTGLSKVVPINIVKATLEVAMSSSP